MNILLAVLCVALACETTGGLQCWTCNNAKTNQECIKQGHLEKCQYNENACHNEVRRDDKGILITKRCKQKWACSNNRMQNDKAAWQPKQCNYRVPSSVCRCCCSTNGCNKYGNECNKAPRCARIRTPTFGKKSCQYVASANEVGSFCTFRCNSGYNMVGETTSKCLLDVIKKGPYYSNPAPRCVRKAASPPKCIRRGVPAKVKMSCTEGENMGSICKYTCDDSHVLIGVGTAKCERDGRWSALPPACAAVKCQKLYPPNYGSMSCSSQNNENSVCRFRCKDAYRLIGSELAICRHIKGTGIWSAETPRCELKKCRRVPTAPLRGQYTCTNSNFLNSKCIFSCDASFRVVGASSTSCIENEKGLMVWTRKSPVCEEIKCDRQKKLKNGKISCTNKNIAGSVCTFECIDDRHREYSVDGVKNNICGNDSRWSHPMPCCTRVCSGFSVVDLVIVVDSSSSIGEDNWITIKKFVRDLIDTFEVGSKAARIGVFRYNTEADTKTQILFSDFPNSKTDLLQAFDDIPYDGRGTYTGNALKYAREVVLAPGRGNRPDVPDYLLLITDGRSADGVERVSKQLHNDGVHVLVIGVEPNKGRLDLVQLNKIISDPEDLAIAKDGVKSLDIKLYHDLVHGICVPGCS